MDSLFSPRIPLTMAAGFLLSIGGAMDSIAQEEAPAEASEVAPEPDVKKVETPSEEGLSSLEKVPEHFPKKQDGLGYEWTVHADGSVDGTNSAMSKAMALVVSDEEFKAETAEIDESGNRIVLTQWRESGVKIARHLLFNTESGGMRYVDVFENTGDEDMNLEIKYTAAFPNQPGAVYANTGKSSNGELGERDAGLALQADDESGRPSVLILFADEKSETKPKVSINKDNALAAVFTLSLKKGERSALVQWIGQRELTDSRSVRDAFDKVYRRRKLEDAQLPSDLSGAVMNFDINATGGVHAPFAEDLVALVQLCGRLDVERDAVDVLWVGSGSRLTGTATSSAAAFELDGRFGKVTIEFSEVAAFQGGGGLGRGHQVYLRDGSVLNGTATVPGLTISGDEGWKVELEMDQLEYLIFRLAPEDGMQSGGKGVYLELQTGDVLTANSPDSQSMAFISPWGKLEIPAGSIRTMRETKYPSPRYHIVLEDGSELTVFIVAQMLELSSERRGALSISSNEIARLWRAGDVLPDEVAEDEYEELEELPPGGFDACLLHGSNVIAGKIVNEKLSLVAGATVTALSPAEIVSIRRGDDDLSELIPVFIVELQGGNQMTGHFQEKTIQLQSEARRWNVPVQHFLSARKKVEEKN